MHDVRLDFGDDPVLALEFERRGMMREIGAQESEARDARCCGERARLVDGDDIVTPQKIEHPVERSRSKRAAFLDEPLRKGSAAGAGAVDARGELLNLDRRLFGEIRINDPALALAGDNVFAHKLLRFRIDDPDPQPADVNDNSCAGILRRRVVVRPVNFDEAIEVYRSFADAIVFKPGQRKLLEICLFLLEHQPNLPFRRAVDTRHRPALVPAIEMGVLLLNALEAPSLQCRFLRVADLRFDLALEIRRVRTARQRDYAVVLEHLGVQRVELRIVDVGLDHAFFEIVQADRTRRAAELHECLFVQLAPNLTRRIPNNFAECAPAIAELHDKKPRPTIFAGLRMTRQRALTVVDLRFLPSVGLETAADLVVARSQFADEAFDRVISADIAVVLDQILVDRNGVAALRRLRFDETAIRLATAARSRRVGGHFRRAGTLWVGGHYGRFWVGGHFAGAGTFSSSAAAASAMRRIVAR